MNGDPALLERNLAALEGLMPTASITALRELALPAGPLVFEPGTAGRPLFQRHVPGGGKLLLHSARDPKAEAERQVAAWAREHDVDWSGFIVVLGFAGMWHVEAIAALAKPGSLLMVIDPEPAAFKTALGAVDLRSLLPPPPDRELAFAVSDDLSILARHFRAQLSRRQAFNRFVFLHPASRRAAPELYAELLELLRSESKLEGMDRGTVAYLSNEWTRNCLLNLPSLLRSQRFDALEGQFAGETAVMVAAGPSLDAAFPVLRSLVGRAVIIAVGTALKPLLKAGVQPDFVVALDWDPKGWRQFDGADPGGAFLITESITCPKVVALFAGRCFFFSSPALPEYNDWLAGFGALPGALAVGGTVSLSALDAAVHMGFSKIVAFGLDLACKEDGTSHAGNSMYHNMRYVPAALERVPGNYVETVPTTRQFALYIKMLEAYAGELAARPSAPQVYNANAAGARIGNLRLIRPEDALALAPAGAQDFRSRAAVRAVRDPLDPEALARARRDTLADLTAIAAEAGEAKDLCAALGSDHGFKDADAGLERLDQIDKSLKRRPETLNLVNGAIKSVCMRVLDDSGQVDSPDGREGFRRSMEDGKLLYTHISLAASWLALELEDAFAK